MGSVAGSVAGHTLRVGSMRQRQKICDRRRRICPFSVLDAEAFFFLAFATKCRKRQLFFRPYSPGSAGTRYLVPTVVRHSLPSLAGVPVAVV